MTRKAAFKLNIETKQSISIDTTRTALRALTAWTNISISLVGNSRLLKISEMAVNEGNSHLSSTVRDSVIIDCTKHRESISTIQLAGELFVSLRLMVMDYRGTFSG